jgi:hypothetical protein
MLDLASSFTVAISPWMAGSAVSPSHFPTMSHWSTAPPCRPDSTIVLSTLPVMLGWPRDPTTFWKPTKTCPSSYVVSSG